MNPGTLDTPITLEERRTNADALGQPLDEWCEVRTIFAARRRPRPILQSEREQRDTARESERRDIVFRVRVQPFVSIYQPGMRIKEPRRSNMPDVIWRIIGWSDVNGTAGQWVDIECATPDAR